MRFRHSALKFSVAALAALLALTAVPVAGAAHLGDSGHIHYPGDSTTPTSSVWCVRFTQDPGVWRPEGESSVDPSLMEGTRLVFVECDELLRDFYAIESFSSGRLERQEVGERIVAQPDESTTDTATDAAADYLTVQQWTKHQRKWLQKGDRLAAKIPRARTVPQAKRALGDIHRHLRSETVWLRKNKARFEPDSCLAQDRSRWQKRIGQAQKSLSKAITAVNRGNVASANSNARQFARAWTKVEQVYNAGLCDF